MPSVLGPWVYRQVSLAQQLRVPYNAKAHTISRAVPAVPEEAADAVVQAIDRTVAQRHIGGKAFQECGVLRQADGRAKARGHYCKRLADCADAVALRATSNYLLSWMEK